MDEMVRAVHRQDRWCQPRSVVAVHRQIRRHPCRGAEAVPDVVSTVAVHPQVVVVLVVLVVLAPQVQVVEKTAGNTLSRWSIFLSYSLEKTVEIRHLQIIEENRSDP